ncbi:MAG: phage tail tip lysozyme [Candidatus Nanopelagicales bacterium]
MGRPVRVVVCAAVLALLTAGPALAAPPVSPPVAEAQSDISVAAKRMADAADAMATAKDSITTAQERLTGAQTAQAGAREAFDAAAAVERVARERAAEAAGEARQATAVEERMRAKEKEAREALLRMARNAYMNSATSSDLALFVSFATDGPRALDAFARRDMAFDNLGDASVVEAERTVREADAAHATAAEKRATFDAADRDHDVAADELSRTRKDLRAAEDDAAQAEDDIAAGHTALTKAKAAYDKAESVYQRELKSAAVAGGGSVGGPAAPIVWSILIRNGFSPQAAAGILGNLQQESGIDPTVTQSGGPGMGLAQWSAGGRWDNGPNSLLSYASAHHLDPWDARTQTEFMIYEMTYGYGGFDLAAYKQMTDVLAATVYFHDVFEGSADSAEAVRAVRGGYALEWYDRFT